MTRKELSDEELRRILEESDFECSEIESTYDDSDADRTFKVDEGSNSESSTTSNDIILPSKKRKIEPTPGPSNRPNSPGKDSSDDSVVAPRSNYVVWSEVCVSDKLNKFVYSGRPGFRQEKINHQNPVDFFLLFFDKEVQDLLVTETNRYAEQQILNGICEETVSEHSIVSKWYDTDAHELMRFFGIIIWMGLDQKPTLRDYWSKKVLYKSEVAKLGRMSRNRFEALLHFLHISDNENCPSGDRLYKISPLVQMLNRKFQHLCNPKDKICIDETMVPFRGRLSFLQYIPGKRHKYGVKLFKLCVDGGYTYSVKIYGGGGGIKTSDKPLATRVVMELMEPLLNTGRTLYTDNFYTSVGLAHELNDNQTHLVGTLRQNRKLNPKAVTSAKLKKGEIKMQQSNTKVVVAKWKDKRDVLFLTTRAVPEMVEVPTKRGSVLKPSTIVEYNTAKGFIDISDQKASYSSPVRRGIKWYRKIVVELLTNTVLVNAMVVFKEVTGKNMSITEFRENIVCALLAVENQPKTENQVQHSIENKKTRGRCSACYKKYSEREGRHSAMKNAKKVYSFCRACSENATYMCVSCFFERHTSFVN
ncbi:piggyBac transposable element-derived protein 4-like [Onthophagus taurus]|uniref:piggyBac transposable element-derived protein 4-like n=1 Tax=Onthophagus taurus TaxID=166361 RepID=UPI000C2039FA|nr:piggyBac transposable element-derived protein 4-like [Onthophagus taurus]XP_022908545.1 piggyBac transposable element-derived protein 4-like [Onthophagus taurus]